MFEEDRMSGEDFDVDQALEELRQALRAEAPPDDPAEGEPSEELRVEHDVSEERLDAELLGLLAYGLEERPPAPYVKGRLMAAIRGEADAPPAQAGKPDGEVASLTDHRRQTVAPLADPSPATASRWLPALAAALFLAVVGLAFFAGKQYGELERQQNVIVDLEGRLAAAGGEVADLSDRLALVATPGVEVCPLRPQGSSPLYPEAKGLLFLSGPSEQWYVRIADLESPPAGQTYRLWFVFGDEARQVGELLPGGDDAVVLAGRAVKSRREMTAALVTLEPVGQSAQRPTGPTILYGDEKMDMI